MRNALALTAYALLVALLMTTFGHAQTVAPTPAPAPSGVYTLVKHVRFPIVSDVAIAAYPNLTICENEAYVYGIDHPQWFTDYTCELRAANKLSHRFHHHRINRHHRR